MTDLKTLQLAAIIKDLRDWGADRIEVCTTPEEEKVFQDMLVVIKNAHIEEATSTEKIRELEELMAFNADNASSGELWEACKGVQEILRKK